ncbi:MULTISPECIES: sugar kinase [unclassified Saccharopolyspora]|uniref:sugar kinase n=1 Tax=unclassified Saccharopolyspora TaxID=2646250 RepID=UPI001CD33D3E|nr:MULTISPECIES: sugar kinase [unclassified Saccharopolyspora]MCA1229754.1 sugar kinase [Saccharopolyspora sp. 6M]MCA1282709.1 sugar kinase [Saccharopolyspora sp. 7B]
MIRVLAIGECMIELTHREADVLSLGCAGDTFNTATYLSRLTGSAELQVDYLTLVGDDHYSDRIVAAMRAEGVGTDRIGRVAGAQPGLYLVRTDEHGERSFTYYRSQSAARGLFADGEPDFDGYDLVHLSAISLQILAPPARERLRAALRRFRDAGGRVSFDSNYRPAGWDGAAAAAEQVRELWSLTTVGLPTFSDEQALFGDPTAESTVDRLRVAGVADVAVKDGAAGCVVLDGERVVRVPAVPVESVVDSTAAGDAFDAGYLAARLTGADPVAAAHRAQELAATVIRHRGAIVAESVLPRRSAAPVG